MQFKNVVGQEEAKAKISQMFAEGRVPHALLLAGGEGCGGMALAMSIAHALLCELPAGGLESPQRRAAAEAMFANLSHPDLYFVYPIFRPKGTPSTKVVLCADFLTEWREMLRENLYFGRQQWREAIRIGTEQLIIYASEADEVVRRLSLTTSQGGWRVLIMWLPELLHPTAANKLLKIVEEPPAQTCIVLVSEHPDRVLATIRSRTQRIDLPPLTVREVADDLCTHSGLEPADAEIIARRAGGNLTEARSLVSAASVEQQYFDLFAVLMRKAYARDVAGLRAWASQMADLGKERGLGFLAYAQRFLRENFIYRLARPELNYLSPWEQQFVERFSRFIGAHNILPLTEIFSSAERDLVQNTHARMVYFDLSLRCIVQLVRKA